jgi:hypothetical protein
VVIVDFVPCLFSECLDLIREKFVGDRSRLASFSIGKLPPHFDPLIADYVAVKRIVITFTYCHVQFESLELLNVIFPPVLQILGCIFVAGFFRPNKEEFLKR